MPAISETVCLRTLTRTGIAERVVNTSGLVSSVEKKRAYCSAESILAVTAASMLVWHDKEGG